MGCLWRCRPSITTISHCVIAVWGCPWSLIGVTNISSFQTTTGWNEELQTLKLTHKHWPLKLLFLWLEIRVGNNWLWISVASFNRKYNLERKIISTNEVLWTKTRNKQSEGNRRRVVLVKVSKSLTQPYWRRKYPCKFVHRSLVEFNIIPFGKKVNWK